MSLTIGLIDYGIGNQASVMSSLRDLGFKVIATDSPEVLDSVDILLLPGVGAFPPAMRELHKRGLVGYLRYQARVKRPIIGICLGMQLLTTASWEDGYTVGLDLVPGEIIPFSDQGWHIGWNSIEIEQSNSILKNYDKEIFYFNHSLQYRGPREFHIAHTRHLTLFPSIIGRDKVVGLQFHPEKSQLAGRLLLRNIMLELASA